MNNGANSMPGVEPGQEGIAIVGMAGRFPGAPDVATFWENIKNGFESITHFSPDELELNVPDATGKDASHYVCAKGMLDNIDMFDARFFGYLPKEAEVMDPQHRIFLEICWEAMEHAGHDPARYPGAVGVYGGCYMDTYVLHNLCSDEAFREKLIESIQVGTLQTELGNDKDYMATRVAYKLGLTGPAMTLQTACSTSLVAIATACQSLDAYQCDMALAGGVTIVLPQKKGYFYKEGSMLSPDGHCRTFDANAAGTVFSHGAAVVLMKRLEDAIADRDTIYSVIRGYATNNDGGDKVSYTAPSVDGQAEVISLALGLGDINARSIGYVEAHGTATPLGDPIEIGGLTKAYRRHTDDNQYCAIGSVKANLGHLDCASGAIGLIKSTLALHEKKLPPQINFTNPNPKIDFENSPFFVNIKLSDWPAGAEPRRAGVSSFGVGGTNAHVVVEEAPALPESGEQRSVHLLPLSARSKSALEAQAEQLAKFLEENPNTNLANAAFTLQVGRQMFEHRRIVVASDVGDAVEKLRAEPKPGEAAKAETSSTEIVFMFPGQGAQYPGMSRELYETEPVFAEVIDTISDCLAADPQFGEDLRDYLLWTEVKSTREEAIACIAQTRLSQPAIFAVEVALAKLFQSWGIVPASMIGHSVGEFAAATIAGVFSLEDAARLVAARGRLMQALPPGKMLAVLAPINKIESGLPEGISVAAVNAPGVTVVSGPSDAIDDYAARLETDGLKSTSLATSHAFHSAMMAEAKAPLIERVAETVRSEATMEIVSTATGKEVAASEFANPSYWGDQLMQPVLFADAVKVAAAKGEHRIFLEVGPGQTLSSLAKQSLTGDLKRKTFAALGPSRDPGSDIEHALGAIGRLWAAGAAPDWDLLQEGAPQRIALPTYPFERKRFWVEPKTSKTSVGAASSLHQHDAAASEQQALPVAQSSGRHDADVEDLVRRQLDLIAAQLDVMRQS